MPFAMGPGSCARQGCHTPRVLPRWRAATCSSAVAFSGAAATSDNLMSARRHAPTSSTLDATTGCRRQRIDTMSRRKSGNRVSARNLIEKRVHDESAPAANQEACDGSDTGGGPRDTAGGAEQSADSPSAFSVVHRKAYMSFQPLFDTVTCF
ncbi:hypothetical protein BS78_01G245800 [Paspalum vaginatum]|nr:hypothetical protein BS78_01G245800 [Paspalum vaginatum]